MPAMRSAACGGSDRNEASQRAWTMLASMARFQDEQLEREKGGDNAEDRVRERHAEVGSLDQRTPETAWGDGARARENRGREAETTTLAPAYLGQ